MCIYIFNLCRRSFRSSRSIVTSLTSHLSSFDLFFCLLSEEYSPSCSPSLSFYLPLNGFPLNSSLRNIICPNNLPLLSIAFKRCLSSLKLFKTSSIVIAIFVNSIMNNTEKGILCKHGACKGVSMFQFFFSYIYFYTL